MTSAKPSGQPSGPSLGSAAGEARSTHKAVISAVSGTMAGGGPITAPGHRKLAYAIPGDTNNIKAIAKDRNPFMAESPVMRVMAES
jgi:hypothetical protein